MELKSLIGRARKQPFEPFVVILQSGTRVPVNHPEEIFFLPNPSKVEEIMVYTRTQNYIFGPNAITAIRSARRNGGR